VTDDSDIRGIRSYFLHIIECPAQYLVMSKIFIDYLHRINSLILMKEVHIHRGKKRKNEQYSQYNQRSRAEFHNLLFVISDHT
jgi:hypothetical protein